jgi:ubiquinone/menaquinone biosynthesis C-methylase UbiE
MKNGKPQKIDNTLLINKIEKYFGYIKRYYPEYETAHQHYDALIYNKFNEICPRKFYFLDAGCGWKNIEVMRHLNDSIYTVGVDIDYDSLANNIIYDNLILCDLEYLPFKKGTFDLITNRSVLEHIKNPDNVFREFQRVITNEGEMIFLLPNLLNPLMLLGKITPTILHKKFINIFTGRNEEDIFHTYFRCNTENMLKYFAYRFGFQIKYLVTCGDFTQFVFGRFSIYCWIIFDKLISIGFFKKFKMNIVVNYDNKKKIK